MANSAQLEELLAPGVEGLGYELWAIDYSTGSKRAMLRIYIDSENGISVDDCAAVSRQVAGVLDVEDPISSEYTLEVSSPGADRSLHKKDHFEKFAGNEVAVRLRYPLEGQRNFKGLLIGVEEGEVVIREGEDEYVFPIEEIDKAKVVPKWD